MSVSSVDRLWRRPLCGEGGQSRTFEVNGEGLLHSSVSCLVKEHGISNFLYACAASFVTAMRDCEAYVGRRDAEKQE